MTPEIKINDYYNYYLADIKKDIDNYRNEIKYLNNVLNKSKEQLNSNKDFYNKYFKIDITDFEKAYEKANSLIKYETNDTKRVFLHSILKTKHIEFKIKEFEKLIISAEKRISLKFRQYQTIIVKFYNQVHKAMLQGFGYKFTKGIGVACICRWKLRESNKQVLDFYATNKKKQKLLAAGKKIYNKNEALWYQTRGIPYDGIDYRVFKTNTHFYDINVIKSNLFTYASHEFERTEYVNIKFKQYSYTEMADMCKDLDEICNLPVDIKYKLNMFLYKDPSNYLLYIRDDEEDYSKFRKNYR